MHITAGPGKAEVQFLRLINVSVAILNLMRHFTGSQWSCFRR